MQVCARLGVQLWVGTAWQYLLNRSFSLYGSWLLSPLSVRCLPLPAPLASSVPV